MKAGKEPQVVCVTTNTSNTVWSNSLLIGQTGRQTVFDVLVVTYARTERDSSDILNTGYASHLMTDTAGPASHTKFSQTLLLRTQSLVEVVKPPWDPVLVLCGCHLIKQYSAGFRTATMKTCADVDVDVYRAFSTYPSRGNRSFTRHKGRLTSCIITFNHIHIRIRIRILVRVRTMI